MEQEIRMTYSFKFGDLVSDKMKFRLRCIINKDSRDFNIKLMTDYVLQENKYGSFI